MSTALNGFEIKFSSDNCDAYVCELPKTDELRALRQRERGEWFFYWREGMLYGIPEVAQPQRTYGESRPLDLTNHHHLSLIASRINDRLPTKFPHYEALRTRPFEFLGKRDEFVATAASHLKSTHPTEPFQNPPSI